MTNVADEMRIEAAPTKGFFIDMLIKDIPLMRSIIDLVDNSLDGARRLRPTGDYTGLNVRIDVLPNQFKIVDNCGGIPCDLARNYAFRFGRSDEMVATEHSIGQFGVGMKRALFKIGGFFHIESTSALSEFVVDIDVDDWKRKPDKWEFAFSKLDRFEKSISEEQTRTLILVTKLHKPVSEVFALENFRNTLAAELAAAHQESMNKGLDITLNEIPLKFRPSVLLQSDALKPWYWENIYTERGQSPITVKIYSGVAESDPANAGWYVYCNGRLVLESDQTFTTGWGETGGSGIPKYHNQFSRFRGYVFFDSDDARLLPWNTTKTGVDSDSGLYKNVRLQMIAMMRPVIDFLNRLDAEKDDPHDVGDRPLETAVASAEIKTLNEALTDKSFVFPSIERKPLPPQTKRIAYTRPIEEYEQVRQMLDVSTPKEVGELTFQYFLDSECQS